MKKLTNEEFLKLVSKLPEVEEYSFLSTYESTHKKIKVKHNLCKNEFYVTPHNFLIGRRCPFCAKNKRIVNKTLSHQEFLNRIKNQLEEYNVLGTYINTHEKIEFEHKKCGTKFFMKPNNFINGQRCPKCMEVSRRMKKRKTKKTFLKNVEKKYGSEYSVIGEYTTNKEKILIRHNSCGNEWMITPHNFLAGHECPSCAAKFSKKEKEVLLFIKSFFTRKIQENRKFNTNGMRYELDIYIPSLKIGIEFDGLYWHSESKVGKKYHINKTNFFKSKGIRVLHIFEDEWMNKKDIVKSKIRHILKSSNQEKVYARKCSIQEVSSNDRNIFLDKYHIQGRDSGSIRAGLYFKDELVSIMTLGKQRLSLGMKKTKEGSFELIRFASSKNVVGGFSKLLKYAISKYNIKQIKTFADLRYSDFNNNVYLTNGFKQTHISSPSYWYFKGAEMKRYHRFIFRKQEVAKKFKDNFNENLTEYENMKNNGYDRIWDCGNLVYEMNIESDN
jgi:very-short-patch-repair endonuclease/Zn ribbon nucleic-acid-binding protein